MLTRDHIIGILHREIWWDTHHSYGSICGLEKAADEILKLSQVLPDPPIRSNDVLSRHILRGDTKSLTDQELLAIQAGLVPVQWVRRQRKFRCKLCKGHGEVFGPDSGFFRCPQCNGSGLRTRRRGTESRGLA